MGTRGVLWEMWVVYWRVEASFETGTTRAFGRKDCWAKVGEGLKKKRRSVEKTI